MYGLLLVTIQLFQTDRYVWDGQGQCKWTPEEGRKELSTQPGPACQPVIVDTGYGLLLVTTASQNYRVLIKVMMLSSSVVAESLGGKLKPNPPFM